MDDAAKELERKIKVNQTINDQMIAYYVSKGEKKGLTIEEMLDKWRDGIHELNEPEPPKGVTIDFIPAKM